VAEHEGVELRLYEVIYQALEDIEAAMVGMLKPEFEEVVTGEAEVREVFSVPKVREGGRLLRPQRHDHPGLQGPFPARPAWVIWKGEIASLKRFKEDAREGPVRLRVRHRPGELPGPEGRRPHRDLHHQGDPAGLTDRRELFRKGGRRL